MQIAFNVFQSIFFFLWLFEHIEFVFKENV